MSLKSFLPAAAALAVATMALTGCSQTANVSGGDSSAPASSSSEGTDHSGHDHSSKSGSSEKSDASGAFTIDESNAHVEIPAGTKTVVINGSNNHIVGEAVSEITINGSANAVEVKSADKASFTGSNNAIQYKDGNAPQVGTDSGANNVVSKG